MRSVMHFNADVFPGSIILEMYTAIVFSVLVKCWWLVTQKREARTSGTLFWIGSRTPSKLTGIQKKVCR